MLIFLKLNGVNLTYSDDELIRLILDVASGSADCKDLSDWLIEHIQ